MSLTVYVQAAETRKWIPGHLKHNGEVNIGDHCTHCGNDTSFGSGRFVNRVPSGHQTERGTPRLDGYMCDECMSMECDLCGQKCGDDWYSEYSEAEGDIVCSECADERGWEIPEDEL